VGGIDASRPSTPHAHSSRFARTRAYCLVASVFPDTNAVFGDTLLTSEPSRSLLAALDPGGAEMHISPVVVAAAARHHVDRVKEETDGLRTRLEKLGRLAGVDSAEAVEDADTLSAEAMAGQEPLRELTAEE
jgi:hypothetical protein